VVDDAAQGITDIVRGSDLLDSTPRQIYLQQLLGYATPVYYHLPVAADKRGDKLSKQTGAAPLNERTPAANIVAALNFLGQQPPAELARADLTSLWHWAQLHWNVKKIPAVLQIEPAADDHP
jgi:glutamyl-Q tRNA(Asp) synthetase